MNAAGKKFHDKATRTLRELRNEKSKYGYIRDGSGRRYRVGVFFLLAGEIEKAEAAFEWFYREFPDDIGEPVFLLYSALTAHRYSRHKSARARLLEAMTSNIYLLPRLVGQSFDAQGVWHPTNWHDEAYLQEIAEFLDEPTPEERAWIATELETDAFRTLKNGYIDTFRQLKLEKDFTKRHEIIAKWDRLRTQCRKQMEEPGV